MTMSLAWWNYLDETEFYETFHHSRKAILTLQTKLSDADGIEFNSEANLLATIWFLTNTASLEDTFKLFALDNTQAVLEEQLLKIARLAEQYVRFPGDEEIKIIENVFETKYQLSGVVGVLGCLHVNIDLSSCKYKSSYYNKLAKKHTLIFQIVVDCNLLLRDVCVGVPGSHSVNDALEQSPLYDQLTKVGNVLKNNKMCILGGYEYPQLNTLLTPHKGTNLTEEQHSFNELHCYAMQAIELFFVDLENRFCRLANLDNFKPHFASLVISAICVLHNFDIMMT